MEYTVTFADVMAGVMTVGLGTLAFFIKGLFNGIMTQIRENDKKTNARIDRLEAETDENIENIKNQINDIKGDFSTSFVLREDFFRSMNSVEDRIKGMDGKLDRLLMQKE